MVILSRVTTPDCERILVTVGGEGREERSDRPPPQNEHLLQAGYSRTRAATVKES